VSIPSFGKVSRVEIIIEKLAAIFPVREEASFIMHGLKTPKLEPAKNHNKISC
jgi:hypothetical protein